MRQWLDNFLAIMLGLAILAGAVGAVMALAGLMIGLEALLGWPGFILGLLVMAGILAVLPGGNR